MKKRLTVLVVATVLVICMGVVFSATGIAAGPDPKKTSAVLKAGGGAVGRGRPGNLSI